MGQRWSMIKNGFLEESESEEDSESLTQLQQSQATTETSSSVAAFDNRGLCSTSLNDIELSNLQSNDATVDTRRGTPPPPLSLSHFSSVKASLKDFEAPCTLRPRKLALDYKVEAYREALHGQFAIRKLGANNAGCFAKSRDGTAPNGTAGEGEMPPRQSPPPKLEEEGDVMMVGRKRKGLLQQSTASQPPFSPAQTLLMFQLDPKRKRPAELPSLAFDDEGYPATHMKQKARTPLERPSEGVVAGEAILDLGTGDAMVGRSVKKVTKDQRQCGKGYVSCYNVAQRLYQIKYDDGKEEELEWLDLEPRLLVKGTAQTRPRYKNVDELVYAKPKRSRKQGRRRR